MVQELGAFEDKYIFKESRRLPMGTIDLNSVPRAIDQMQFRALLCRIRKSPPRTLSGVP